VSGRLVVLSGPSGVGKGTVVAAARDLDPGLWCSVSVTTREQRPGEIEGVHYHFVSDEQFDALVAGSGLLEWAGFAGNRYGTPRAPVAARLALGEAVLLEIELQGARQIRARMPDAVMVFLQPPSREELESRLRGRGTEDASAITRRLERAAAELAAAGEFDVVIVNDDVKRAAQQLLELL
jgi:guanylate kinase